MGADTKMPYMRIQDGKKRSRRIEIMTREFHKKATIDAIFKDRVFILDGELQEEELRDALEAAYDAGSQILCR